MKRILTIITILFFIGGGALFAEGSQEDFSDKGPAELLRDVQSQISNDERIDEEFIIVSIDGKTAVLEGSVDTRFEYETAEKVAWMVPGVVDVENELTIEISEEYPTDEFIANRIRNIIGEYPTPFEDDIEVESINGQVTLEGTVSTYAEKVELERLAQTVSGVVGVTNELTIVPTETVADEWIADTINDVIDRSVSLNADDITVTVMDGEVILSGLVTEYEDIEKARLIAENTAGVVSITNRLEVMEPSREVLDDEIAVDIRAQLAWDSRVEIPEVEVEVEDGRVTLSGAVDTLDEKRAAEQTIRDIAGIREINNELDVLIDKAELGKGFLVSDVITNISRNVSVDVEDLEVREQRNTIVIEGTVDSVWKKYRIEDLAFDAPGVVDVHNKLAVVPTDAYEDKVIAERLEESLSRNNAVDAEYIDITVEDGHVTLGGTAKDYLAWNEAVSTASTTKGVRSVTDDIKVSELE